MSTQFSTVSRICLSETARDSEIHVAPLLHTAKKATATFSDLLLLRHQLELRSAAKRGEIHLVPPHMPPYCGGAPDPRYEEISLAALRKRVSQSLLRSQLTVN